jgi:hypothetical protein
MKTKQLEKIKKPKVGKYYMVKCVKLIKIWGALYVPVIGNFHTDKELAFDIEHIHIDYRFMPYKTVKKLLYNRFLMAWSLTTLQSSILKNKKFKIIRRKMHREFVDFPNVNELKGSFKRKYIKLQDTMKNNHCKLIDGHICPHKGTSLKNVLPNEKGLLKCPTHGLLFSSKTGNLIKQRVKEVKK